MKSKKLTAFTLAEVLITLVVIGAVAAMTIPSLINNISDQQYKIAWRKTFGDLSQVTQRIAVDNGGTLEGLFSNDNDIRNNYLAYMNYVKSCNSGQIAGNCWNLTQKTLNGSTASESDLAGAVLSNGSLLRFYFLSRTCTETGAFGTGMPTCGAIYIDINGFNGPNTWGKDMFGIIIKKDRIVPRGTQGDTSPNSNCTTHGIGCSALYLYQ